MYSLRVYYNHIKANKPLNKMRTKKEDRTKFDSERLARKVERDARKKERMDEAARAQRRRGVKLCHLLPALAGKKSWWTKNGHRPATLSLIKE